MSQKDNKILLADFIEQVVREIELRHQNAMKGTTPPSFKVEKLELEIKVDVKTSKEGKIEFPVLSFLNLGGKKEKSGSSAHTVKITLTPASGIIAARVKVNPKIKA